jgi:hypothetical protein
VRAGWHGHVSACDIYIERKGVNDRFQQGSDDWLMGFCAYFLLRRSLQQVGRSSLARTTDCLSLLKFRRERRAAATLECAALPLGEIVASNLS